jgi:hypothetical protein
MEVEAGTPLVSTGRFKAINSDTITGLNDVIITIVIVFEAIWGRYIPSRERRLIDHLVWIIYGFP